MNELRGRFYFRLTTNGNLVGEFSNDQSTHSQPESAERIPQNSGSTKTPFGFLGAYQSSWFEPTANQAILARLEITQKLGTHQIYTLRWISNAVEYEGEAMIGEGLLIGDYRMIPT